MIKSLYIASFLSVLIDTVRVHQNLYLCMFIYIFIYDKCLLVLIDFIISSLFLTVQLPLLQKIIKLINENMIFRLIQVTNSLTCSSLFPAIFFDSFAQKCLHSK